MFHTNDISSTWEANLKRWTHLCCEPRSPCHHWTTSRP